MQRAIFLLCALALVARGGDAQETTVTTFVVQDAARLLEGTSSDVALEGGKALTGFTAEPSSHETDGDVVGPLIEAKAPFDRACVSVNAELPPDSRVEVSARVHLEGDAVTEWLPLGTLARPGVLETVPSSADPYDSRDAKVVVDTIVLPRAKGKAIEVKLAIHRRARVRRIAVVAWSHGKRDEEKPSKQHPAWGKILAVPERSQRTEDPKIEGRICSATSLGMVLAFHGFDRPTAEVCREVLDRRAGIYGNWALNVAYAGRLGLDAAIERFSSFEPLEAEIAAGRPVVISHRWAKGELTGAPVSATDGHLIVVRGFTREGDVVVNDPAADPRKGEKVERVYPRSEIARTWLYRGDGIAYVIARRTAK